MVVRLIKRSFIVLIHLFHFSCIIYRLNLLLFQILKAKEISELNTARLYLLNIASKYPDTCRVCEDIPTAVTFVAQIKEASDRQVAEEAANATPPQFQEVSPNAPAFTHRSSFGSGSSSSTFASAGWKRKSLTIIAGETLSASVKALVIEHDSSQP